MRYLNQKGIVAPLIAAVLLGLMGIMYTLIFDNYIVAIETSKFRSKVKQLCFDVTQEAPIHRATIEAFDEKITALRNDLPSWFEIVSSTLTMGTMPEAYNSGNLNIGTNRIDSCATNSASRGFNENAITSLVLTNPIKFEWNLCSSNFAEKWGTLNLSKDYHAGTFVGCEVKGRIRTYFSPRTVPAGIAKRETDEGTNDAQARTRLVYSRFGFWKFPWTDDNPTGQSQGLVIAIAPQIPFEPNNPTLSTVPNDPNPNQFMDTYVENGSRNNYLGIVGPNLNRLRLPAGLSERAIAPALFDSDIGTLDKRRALYRLYAGQPTVLRQRISSALIELASRDGMLRSNTAVLLANPRNEISAGAPDEINPPIILRDSGEDLRANNINSTPLLFTKFIYPFDSTIIHSNPYYLLNGSNLPLDDDAARKVELSSLISRFSSMGFHLDSSYDWHQERLFRNQGNFPWSSLRNATDTLSFEPSLFDWGNVGNDHDPYYSLWSHEFESAASNHSDYFDRLNHFNRPPTGFTDAHNLSVSQLARTLGPSVMCPFMLRRTDLVCPNFIGFHPDVEGVLKAWLGIPGDDTSMYNRDNTASIPATNESTVTPFNAVRMPGLYSNAVTAGTWSPGRPSQLVLILHSHLYDNSTFNPTEQVARVRNTFIDRHILYDLPMDPKDKLPQPGERPMTIIYIPTREQDSTEGVVDNMAGFFHANVCSPIVRSDFRRGNVLIPFVHDSDQYSHLSCIAETFPCTREDTLQAVWDCMLAGNNPENIAKQIFNTTIMRSTRIF